MTSTVKIAHMESMNVSLPEGLKSFVEERVRTGGYGTVSEYVRALVREDQKRQTDDQIEALLIEATRSGPGRELSKADWSALRQELDRRLAKRSRA